MSADCPHQLDAALCVAYRYHLWLVKGEPVVYHHVPAKRDTKHVRAAPEHWERLVSIDAIPRLDAKMAIKQAWEQDAQWRSAYTVGSKP